MHLRTFTVSLALLTGAATAHAQAFPIGHQASAMVTAANAVTPVLQTQAVSANSGPGLTGFAYRRGWDQMVELLRRNAVAPPAAAGQSPANPPPGQGTQPPSDGQHDFDFEIGEWSTHLRRLQRPLTGSTIWVEYSGTTTVRPILGGRANLAELVVEGPAGRIEGAALRLYSPQSRQWTLNFFNIADGALTPPVAGEFRNGRGVFQGVDTLGGRSILVRFVIT
ncbi:MAG TPA: hypothetical protein VMZ66_08535, partial [Aeromicrobium sp.]|nr:hypothetical protein [Aeromicrobium sp.]